MRCLTSAGNHKLLAAGPRALATPFFGSLGVSGSRRQLRHNNLSVSSHALQLVTNGPGIFSSAMTDAMDNSTVPFPATLHRRGSHSANDSGVSEPLSVTYEGNPYLGDFSRRVAARLAGLPRSTALPRLESEDEPRISWNLFQRSYKLILAVMVGAILYGGILYSLLSELRSPGPSAGATAISAAVRR
jgi:hypothetical protein